MDHVAVPVGATPPVGPDTVAVKIKLEPKDAVAALVVTVTVGATLEITIP